MDTKETKEEISRAVQKALEEELGNFTKELSYKVGNATLKALHVQEKVEEIGNAGAAIQAGYCMGSTAWGAAEDISRNDKVCTGLCLLATACEGVAFTTRVMRVPYGMKLYVGCKAASSGLMKFRNLCRTADSQILPC
jgi:hypothetical protein